MATGNDRRGQVQSPFSTGVDLAQRAGLQPTVAVPGIARPAGMNVQPVDTNMMNELAAWGGKAIQDKAAKQMNASLLDGQMAQAQGESFAAVETGGDKWKIEGFHQMEAQTMSAQLLEAQKAEIANSAYAMSPGQYREQFNTRVNALLEGKDPRVQDLVRMQIAEQVPILAGAQTGAYTNYAAQRTYEAGVNAVHAISQDPSGAAVLAAIADPGPNSPLAALGPNERRAAITDGVLFAFQNDNPGAYIQMKAMGTFDQFTPEQQARIEAGRKDWMARMASQFDPVRMEAFNQFNAKLDLGGGVGGFASPMDAVNAAKGMYDKFGLDFDNQAAWQVMTTAQTGVSATQQTTMNNIQTALVSKDYSAAAQMVANQLGANPNDPNFTAQFAGMLSASGGDLEKAIAAWHQQTTGVDTMDAGGAPRRAKPQVNLNYDGAPNMSGVTPQAQSAFATLVANYGPLKVVSAYRDPKHNADVGGARDSQHTHGNAFDVNTTGWSEADKAALIVAARQAGFGGIGVYNNNLHFDVGTTRNWGPDYHSGSTPAWAAEALGTATGVSDPNATPSDVYAKGVMEALSGAPTAARRLAESQVALEAATNGAQVAAYSQMAPMRDQLDSAFINGQMSQTDWQSQRGALYDKYHMQRTTNDVDQEIAITHQAQKQAAEAGMGAAATQYGMQMAEAEANMKAVVDSPTTTMDEKRAAIADYGNTRQQLVTQMGLPRNPDQEQGFYRGLQKVWADAVAAEETNGPKRVAVARAAATGTLGSDASIDPKFRDEWYKGVVQSAQQDAARLVAKDPKYTPQANAMVQGEVMDKLAKAGYIPEGLQARYTASVEGNLVDKNGNPTPEAVATINDYMAMRVKNPRVASMMFTGTRASAIAGQIANMAGDTPAGIESAITAFNNMPPVIAGLKSAAELAAAPELQSAVSDRVSDFVWQRHGAAWNRETIWSYLPNSTALQADVQQLAAEKWAAAGGKGDPTAHVKDAITEIGARTTMIAGAMVTAPKGVNISVETFGNDDMSNDPHAVDYALRMFIKEHAGDPKYGIPPDINMPWQDRPTEANGLGGWLALPFVGVGKYATQAGAFLKTPFRSDASAAGLFNFNVEMVPNTIERKSNGTFVTVTLLDAENYGKMVTIPLAEAGRAYTQWRTKNAYTP